MTIGIAPITGITLPFVSFGGSSLITLMIMVGLLEAIHIRGRLAAER
jgi:rod shape determining protein RodA